MKIFKSVLFVLLLSAAAYGQTEDLGLGAFSSERGPILLAVDAALVDFQMNSPYVMFVFYMASKNQNKDIVVGRDGVVISADGRSAVFLPQVAPEQGWNRDQMLDNLCLKAGLAANRWRRGPVRFETFQAEVFDERQMK